jgi:hypothetical protein
MFDNSQCYIPISDKMPLIDGATVDGKFSGFSILQTDYKKIGDNGTRADILILKSTLQD